MGNTPEYFKCDIVGWNQIHRIVENATRDVVRSDFTPTAVVGIARGGWIPARCVADFLEIDNLTSVKIDHYQGTDKTDDAELQFETRSEATEGEDVLLVDDIVDTGKTLSKAIDDIESGRAREARSLTIHSLPSSEIEPGYVGKQYEEFHWVIYPWNVTEDVNQVVNNVITQKEGKVHLRELKNRLDEYHSVNENDFSKLGYTLERFLEILDERNELDYENNRVQLGH